MSEKYLLIKSVETLAISPTSSLEVLRVSRSAPPTPRERALRTITCSGNGRASSSKCDLFGARLRIALDHGLRVSTGYSMRWLRQATPRGHAWWVLTMPGRTTDGSDFGSLLPTPSASEYGSNRGGAAGRAGPTRPSLASMIPTPTHETSQQGPRPKGRTGKEGKNLIEVFSAQMIPTPMGGSRAERGGTPMDVSGWARERMQMVLTPTAQSGEASHRMRDMISTPIASLSKGSRGRNGNRGPKRGTTHVILPTPTARDVRSDRALEATMDRNSRPLSEQSGHLGLTGTVASPVSQRRALLLGLVLWMMAASPDFLRACATVPLPRSGTRSSTRSRKRSAER